MKKVKGLLLVAVLSFVLFTSNVFAKDKVKVYIFEAGGCPYCEAEIEYLKKLDSYNEKFKIIQKELYVDHINWEQGKDYDLGVKVAEAFLAKGYQNASYQGTPFVVIGNRYAAAAYSESLESVINEAYENEDADIVSCIEDGDDDCADKIAESKEEPATTTSEPETGDIATTGTKEEEDNNSTTTVIVLVGVVVAIAVLLIIARGKTKSSEEIEEVQEKPKKEEKETKEETEKPKTTTKKTTKKVTKKPTTKKNKKTTKK